MYWAMYRCKGKYRCRMFYCHYNAVKFADLWEHLTGAELIRNF